MVSPLFGGAVHEALIWALTGESTRWAVGAAGRSGTPAGTSGADHSDHSLGSGASLCARTRIVYDCPFCSPPQMWELPDTEICPPPGEGAICRSKELTGDPRVSGVDHSTSSSPSPKVSCGAAGRSGRTSGRATAEGPEGSESPTGLVAVTVKLYSTLFVSPPMVQVMVGQSWLTPSASTR